MREVNGTWPNPDIAILPDNILWQNMGYGPKNRAVRAFIIWSIAILIIIGAFFGILYFKGLQEQNSESIVIPSDCSQEITKQDAFNDIKLLPSQQVGAMHCYCFNEMFKKYNRNTIDITFTDIDENDEVLHCKDWFTAYSYSTAIKQGAPIIISIINVLASTIFSILGEFEKKYTKNDQTMSTFIKITILQYFNIAVVILLVAFDIKLDILNAFGILVGDYTDFSVDWYRKIGATLSMTILINSVSPHISPIMKPIMKAT